MSSSSAAIGGARMLRSGARPNVRSGRVSSRIVDLPALFDVVDDAHFEVEILPTGPDYLVTANRLVGGGSSSGVPVGLRWSSVVWLEGGRLARGVGYQRRREALEARGIKQPDA